MSKDRARLESEAPTIGQSAGTAPTLLNSERNQSTGEAAARPDDKMITAAVPAPVPGPDLVSDLVSGDSADEFTRHESTPRRQIDRYQVLRSLGSGGMGVVSLAYDPRLKRKVALKLLRPELRDSPDGTEARQRMVREGQALAALSHPNVMTVHDVGSWDGGVFIAMEFVRGATLSDWIGEQSPGWREVLQVFVQAGRGLEAAHGVGLVHRDVKPSNILLGEDGRVRVTDFGLATVSETGAGIEERKDAILAAKTEESVIGAEGVTAAESVTAAEEAMGADALTRTGALLGTPAYMSPEQLEGRRADAQSDQFSFCVSLYEALSGRRPFQGATLLELTESVNQDPVSEAGLSGVPRAVRVAILRGLRPGPVDRFDSMTTLLGELERGLDGSPARAASRIRLSTLFSAAALVVALATVAGWLFLRPPWRSESGPPAQPVSTPVAGNDSVPIREALTPAEPPENEPMAPAVMRVSPRLRHASQRSGLVLPQRRIAPPRRRRVSQRPRVTTPPGNRTPPPFMRGTVDPRVVEGRKKAKILMRISTLQTQVFAFSQKGQGKRCLAAVAELNRLAPATARRFLYYRAICTMHAGDCAQGKRLLRLYLKSVPHLTAANIARQLQSESARRCP